MGRARDHGKDVGFVESVGVDLDGVDGDDGTQGATFGPDNLDAIGLFGGGAVGDADVEVVADATIAEELVGFAASAQDGGFSAGAAGAGHGESKDRKEEKDQNGIDKSARSFEAEARPAFDFGLRSITDQALGFVDLGHDGVASVDTLGAIDTFHL